MAYYSKAELAELGLKSFGENVKISKKASIYDPSEIEIGDNSRIDDFCVISGRVTIGSYNHITPMCLVAGGQPGVFLSDFCTLAYGVFVFAQSDDYTGQTMVNSMIPKEFKKEVGLPVFVGRQTVFGARTIVMPGVEIGEGCSFGAASLVNKSTPPWGVYVGQPAQRIRDRDKGLLVLEAKFLSDTDSIDTKY
jgi:acetyltransferase-like isoleucine patch superfamily enzyme